MRVAPWLSGAWIATCQVPTQAQPPQTGNDTTYVMCTEQPPPTDDDDNRCMRDVLHDTEVRVMCTHAPSSRMSDAMDSATRVVAVCMRDANRPAQSALPTATPSETS
eukprot:2373179-Rhodomonas_salina.3